MHAVPQNAQPSRDAQGSLRVFRDLGASDALRDDEVDIVLVERAVPENVRPLAEARCAFGPVFTYVERLQIDSLDEGALAGLYEALGDTPLRAWLARDTKALAERWAALTGRRHARALVSLVDTDKCSKLHCDFIDLRLLCTYAGPGTWLAPERALDRGALARVGTGASTNERICRDPSLLLQASAGDVVFLKGRRWRDGARGAVHRSPALERTGRRRLVLTVDGMGCP